MLISNMQFNFDVILLYSILIYIVSTIYVRVTLTFQGEIFLRTFSRWVRLSCSLSICLFFLWGKIGFNHLRTIRLSTLNLDNLVHKRGHEIGAWDVLLLTMFTIS